MIIVTKNLNEKVNLFSKNNQKMFSTEAGVKFKYWQSFLISYIFNIISFLLCIKKESTVLYYIGNAIILIMLFIFLFLKINFPISKIVLTCLLYIFIILINKANNANNANKANNANNANFYNIGTTIVILSIILCFFLNFNFSNLTSFVLICLSLVVLIGVIIKNI